MLTRSNTSAPMSTPLSASSSVKPMRFVRSDLGRIGRFQSLALAANLIYEKLLAAIYGLFAGCISELRNFCYRMSLRVQRSNQLRCPLGSVFHQTPAGHLELCIRTRANTEDIQNFAAAHPYTTVLDWRFYQMGWEAGAKWAANNACSCTPKSIGKA